MNSFEITLLIENSENRPTVLDMAESHGFKLRAGCRAGACGKCQIQILEGENRLSQASQREVRCLLIAKKKEPPLFRLACQAKILDNGPLILKCEGN